MSDSDDPDFELSEEDESCSESEDNVEQISTSSSSDSEGEGESAGFLMSKNGLIQYSEEPMLHSRRGRISRENIINLSPGLTRYSASRITDEELSSFLLFFPPPMLQTIVKYTNIEGRRIFEDIWEDVDSIDIQAYIGLLLLAGVYRSNNESTESLWDAEKGRPIFCATMPLKTLKKFNRVVRFDNRQTRSERRQTDKFAPIRDLWNQWIDILPKLYNPSENVTVDEQLVAFRGKCPFRQYMPSKPAKYGIKFWVLCDSATSYVWNIQPYTGKEIGHAPERNQGMRIVLDLTRGLSGHNVTTDNFFTSHELSQQLLERHLTIVGTIRKNKPTLPQELLNTRGKSVYTSCFAFTENITLVSYIPKRNKCVTLLSTLHNNKEVSDRNDKKPQIILDYNKCKGGVDTLDKAVSCYTCKRKTNRWPQIVFSNIIDISAYNAFVLFTSANNAWMKGLLSKRRLFLENLGIQLVTPYIQKRKSMPRSSFSLEITRKIQGSISNQQPSTSTQTEGDSNAGRKTMKRARCNYCVKSDNKTSLVCVVCKKYVCKRHSKNIIVCSQCEL